MNTDSSGDVALIVSKEALAELVKITDEQISSGGTCTVYRGFSYVRNNEVAVKSYRENTNQMFIEREVAIHSNLQHPNIVRFLHATLDAPGRVVLELSIEDALHYYNRSKPLPNLCVGGIALQTLRALCYVHSRGIVHCDVKPENLLLGPAEYSQGIPMTKLSDFGHASHLEGAAASKDRDFWSKNKGGGTPYYIAPEVLESTRRGAERDVWALGVSVFALMVGEFPFSPDHAPGKQDYEEAELLAATLPSSARSFTFELLNPAWEKIPTPTQAMTQQWMREVVALEP